MLWAFPAFVLLSRAVMSSGNPKKRRKRDGLGMTAHEERYAAQSHPFDVSGSLRQVRAACKGM